jgi:protein disulfide-isomerase/protein disulfide-isomerase A1
MTEGLDSKETITSFFANHSFPLFGLLDSDSFSRYMDRGLGVVWAMFPMKEDDKIEEVIEKERAMMTKVAAALLGRYSVIYTDTNQFRDAIENMLGVKEFPAVVVHKKAGDKKKYMYDGSMQTDKIVEFVGAVEAGKVVPQLKSEPEPERNDGPVKVVVGTTLEQMVFTEDKDVLLEIYAPWCGHCKKLEPEFIKMGKKVVKDGVTDILAVAKLDGTANDSPVDSIAWTGFPTIYYVKANSKEPLRYEGERTAKSMWKWVRSEHSKADVVSERLRKKKAAEVAAANLEL